MSLLYQVELWTGKVSTHRIDVLGAAAKPAHAIQALRSAFWDFRFEFNGPIFMVLSGSDALIAGGIGEGEEGTWDVLVGLQEDAGRKVKVRSAPRAGRWLALALLRGWPIENDEDTARILEAVAHLAAVAVFRVEA
jgi:hypothetical protein